MYGRFQEQNKDEILIGSDWQTSVYQMVNISALWAMQSLFQLLNSCHCGAKATIDNEWVSVCSNEILSTKTGSRVIWPIYYNLLTFMLEIGK